MIQLPKILIPKSVRNLVIGLCYVFPFLGFTQFQELTDSLEVFPHALSISEIADYGKQSLELTVAVKRLMENSDDLKSIRENLTADDSLVVGHISILQDTLTKYNLDQLDNLDNQLSIYYNKTRSEEEKIVEWRQLTDSYREQLALETQVWRLTVDSLTQAKNNLSEEDSAKVITFDRVNSQAASAMESLSLLNSEFNTWDENLKDVENALTITRGDFNQVFELISDGRDNFINNIWTPEYGAIWKMHEDMPNIGSSLTLKEQIEAKFLMLKRYNRDHRSFYYRLLFSFLFIVALIFYMRKKAKVLFQHDPKILEHSKKVFKYPMLTALVLLGYFVLIFIDIPDQIRYLVILIAVLPLSIFLWEQKEHKKLTYVFLFIVFSLIFIMLPLLSEQIVTLRYSLLIINLLAILMLFMLRKDQSTIDEENPYWLGTLPFLITVALFLAGVAIFADIVGSVQLSLVLTRSILGTFLAYIIIKETVHLLQSFLFLFLMGPLYQYSNVLKEDSDLVLNKLFRFLKIASYVYWIYVILGLLKIRDSLIDSFMNFINTPLVVGEIGISLGNIIAFYLVIQISLWLSQFIRYFLGKEVFPRTRVDEGVTSTISLLIRYTFVLIGFILALAAAGVELNKVVVGISALGIGIGFGLQNIVNNFVSGIILALERPIKIGDIVKVDETEGIVQDIGLRASQIRTWDGSDVLVPNGSLVSGKLTNWTFSDKRRRLEVLVRLPVGADISEVSQLVLKEARSLPQLSKKHEPYLNYEGIQEGTSILKVYGWIDNYSNSFSAGTAFRVAIYDALKREGIEMALPVVDVKLDKNQ
jgi:small-conductance mechanosensitive channel